MTKADRLRVANELVSLYMKLYKDRFREAPILNRHKQKFALHDILEDIAQSELRKLIAYYVKVDSDPSLTKFCYEYDELYVRMQRDAKDEDERLQLRRETQRRVSEFRERYGKNAE